MKRLIGGQPLYTKDERVFSNASVLCVGNSGKTITYQIRSEHGNIGILKENEVEEWFNLHRQDEEELLPSVRGIPGGSFLLKVVEAHAANIKKIVSADLYSVEMDDFYVCSLIVNVKHWKRFSELLCLSDGI